VDDLAAVGLLQGDRELADEGGDLAHGQRLGRGVEQRGQRLAFDKGHRQVRPAADLAKVVDGTQVGVLQRGGRAGLAVEALEDQWSVIRREVWHLEGNGALELRIVGQVDGAHPAAAEFFLNAVATEHWG
jgi:hypothetical protein